MQNNSTTGKRPRIGCYPGVSTSHRR